MSKKQEQIVQTEYDRYYEYEGNFLNSIRGSVTKSNYLYSFTKYRKFVETNEGTNNITHNDPRIVESQIIDFLISLKARGLSYNSIRGIYAAIVHFYTMNDIIISRKKIIKLINTDEKRE